MEDQLIAILKDSDFGLKDKPFFNEETRRSARGLVFLPNNQVALFHKKKKNEYKLPGGGIENNESPEACFRREVLEETGVVIDSLEYLGHFIEEKSQSNFRQISYVYKGYGSIQLNHLDLTKKENDEGGEVVFVSLKDAYRLISQSSKNSVASIHENAYVTRFINKRDALIVEFILKSM